MKISLLFFWLFTLMLSSASTKAQRYQFQIFSTANGLVDSNVTCINQSKQGNLWIGTEEGLSIFDGIKFRNFTINNGLAENWITTILPLTSGDVILGHKTGYLSLYDLKSKSFKPILSAQNLESHEVKQLAQIDSNSIVLISDVGKVFKIKLNQEYQISDLNFGDKVQHIKKVLAMDSNRYLVAHSKGLDLIKNNRRSSLVKDSIVDFALLSNKLIVVLSPQRIYSFNSKTLKRTLLPQGIRQLYKNSNEKFDFIGIQGDLEGHLWIRTASQTIFEIDNEKITRLNQHSGLTNEKIFTHFVDRENNLWISGPNGLECFLGEVFITYANEIDAHNIVWDVLIAGRNKIAIGSNSGTSFIELNENNGVVESNTVYHNEIITSLLKLDDLIISASQSGKLFVGKYGKGGRLLHQFESPINALEQKSLNSFWVGTDHGLYEFNSHGLIKKHELQGSVHQMITFISKDLFGNTWLGNWSGGLYKLIGEDFIKQNFNIPEIDRGVIFSICAQSPNNLWLGSARVGLINVNAQTNQYTVYTWQYGLKNVTPRALTFADDHTLYIGGEFGLETFNTKTKRFKSFGVKSGFEGGSINTNSFCFDARKKLFMGTTKGLVSHTPKFLLSKILIPNLSFDTVKANGKRWPILEKSVFKSDENNLTISFKSYSPASAREVLYSTRLLPVEPYWNLPNKQRSVNLKQLKPGDYEFQVRCSLGKTMSETISYPFSIRIPFYESTWFFSLQFSVLVVLFLFASIYGRSTQGSRMATILTTLGVIILFEWAFHLMDAKIDDFSKGIGFMKVLLNVLLTLILFPIERLIKKAVLKMKK